MFYTLTDYQTIIEENTSTILPESVKPILDKIMKQLGVTVQTVYTKVSSMNDHKKQHNRHNKKNNQQLQDWESVRSFKTTVINQEKDGPETEIRGSLNKLSQNNYEKNRDIIFQKMDSITEPTKMQQIAHMIFDIASTNKFFSEIYSKLFKELAEKYEIFHEILADFLEGFMNRLHSIRFVDQNVDYDAYCANNKTNDAMKAISLFITNLVKNAVVSIDKVINILYDIQQTIFEYIRMPEKTNEVEELTEHLFIIFSPMASLIKQHERGQEILQKIREMSEWKLKEFASISSRAIFKYKDLVSL